MHRHLVHRLTVGFRILQQNREDKVEVEHDTDLATSKLFHYTIFLNKNNNNRETKITFLDIDTPVLGSSYREKLSFSPTSPVSSIANDLKSEKQDIQSRGNLIIFFENFAIELRS